MISFAASLPMYNLPEMREANAAFWRALSEELSAEGVGALPTALDFARPPVPKEIGDDVLFTQTCGYPLQTIYRAQHQLLAVPTYDAPGCGDATHCAFILVREDSPYRRLEDLRGSTFALNSRHSNSGMNLPRLLLAPIADGKPFFGAIVETGGHGPSIERIKAGDADCASIDNMTYVFMQDFRPAFVQGLRVLAQTSSSPAIPFVTSAMTRPREVAALRAALLRVGSDSRHRPVLRPLRIKAISPADPDAYRALMDYERQAAEMGYPQIA
jgi:ABC-type phosphate/phosphonate transport system substrate-binding protein